MGKKFVTRDSQVSFSKGLMEEFKGWTGGGGGLGAELSHSCCQTHFGVSVRAEHRKVVVVYCNNVWLSFAAFVNTSYYKNNKLHSLYNSLRDFFLFLVISLNSIRLIVAYSKALWQCEKGAWEVCISTPVALGHWGNLLWTLSREQTERSRWHMKWKEFTTQKGLIAEHSFDLTVLTKKLLQHCLILRGKQKPFFPRKKRWQQIIFYSCSNIVWTGESGFLCLFKDATERWADLASFWDAVRQVVLLACISVPSLRKLRQLIQSLAIPCWATSTSSSVPSISNVQKILLSFPEELRLAGPHSQAVFVALLYEVIRFYSVSHGLYLQSLTFS